VKRGYENNSCSFRDPRKHINALRGEENVEFVNIKPGET
jgi:hypothetical protein